MEMPTPKERAVLVQLNAEGPSHTSTVLTNVTYPMVRSTLLVLLKDMEAAKLVKSWDDDEWKGTGTRRCWATTEKGDKMVQAIEAFEEVWADTESTQSTSQDVKLARRACLGMDREQQDLFIGLVDGTGPQVSEDTMGDFWVEGLTDADGHLTPVGRAAHKLLKDGFARCLLSLFRIRAIVQWCTMNAPNPTPFSGSEPSVKEVATALRLPRAPVSTPLRISGWPVPPLVR